MTNANVGAATPPAPPPKSRAVAAVLSFVLPGLGQMFVGHTVRGIAWLLVPVVGVTVFLTVASEPSPMTIAKVLVGLLFVGWLGSIIDAVLIPPGKHRPASLAPMVIVPIAAFLAVPVSALLLRVFVMESFKVPSGAMIPTVLVGDHLFADKSVYRKRLPRRGEVFIFQYPEHRDQDFVKRAIAIGGDKLEVRDGHPLINGWEVSSCAVGKYDYTEEDSGTKHEGDLFVEFLEASAYLVFLEKNSLTTGYQGPYFVKPGETWVLGDNRNNSHDSRMWFGGQGGGVPSSHVRGRARLVWKGATPGRDDIDFTRDPVAPSRELATPLAACLAHRPSVQAATPPLPKSTN